MPNWVYNNVSVSGKTEDLLAFAKKAEQQYETQWVTSEWKWDEEQKKNVRIPEEERKVEIELSGVSPLSFWNFIRPADEELPYYFGHKVKPEDEPDPDATSEERMAKALTFSGSGSYDWNVREWGTKWDANDAELDTDLAELDGHINNTLSYRFSTAWSIPTPVFEAMIKQHPELDFDFSSEEEQGWGAEFTSSDGEDGEERSLIETNSWDIPESHADYVARDNEDGCICSHYEDEDDWYEDCPRDDKDYYVVVTKTYRVSASNAENAYNLATDNDPDEQMELIEDETTIIIKDENGERLYPTLDGEPTGKPHTHRFVPRYIADENGEGSVYSGSLACVFCNEERESETDEIVTEEVSE